MQNYTDIASVHFLVINGFAFKKLLKKYVDFIHEIKYLWDDQRRYKK
jgi:hypothetical protein